MERMARISGDSLVVEFVDVRAGADISQMFHPSIVEMFHPATAEVELGWAWNGSSFSRPAGASLADLKNAKLAAVNAKLDTIIAGGYTHNFGSTAGIRTLDQRDARDETAWLSVKLITADMIAADQGATQIEVRDAGNETFRCSATTANAVMSAMGMWRSAVSSASWAIKDAIEAAENQAALDAIDVDEGWPA